MVLYDYYRSSAAYRVRIALALKDIPFERHVVHLLRSGGEQKGAAYLAKNPQALVPALELDNGAVLTQSLAIIEYLEALKPEPRLIPADPVLAARARSVALAIACDIHPLGNLRVTNYLQHKLGASEEAIKAWRGHWVALGLQAIEQMAQPAPWCFGAEPSIADICLAPQIYYAERFGIPLEDYPKLRSIAAVCAAHPAFHAAHPSVQPEAEQTASTP